MSQLLEENKLLSATLLEKERTERKLRKDLLEAESRAEQLAVQARFSFRSVEEDDNLVRFYTGLLCAEAFDCLFTSMEHYYAAGLIRSGSTWDGEGNRPGGYQGHTVIPARDQLFLTLMRLCLGSPIADLAHRFCIHQSTVSRIFNTILDLLYRHFSTMNNEFWRSRRVVDQNMPEEFRRCFRYTLCHRLHGNTD